MTNPRKVYRDAAQLAAIQLDRPFTAQDIARIEACIEQANIAQNPNERNGYDALRLLNELTPSLSTETYKPLAPLSLRIKEPPPSKAPVLEREIRSICSIAFCSRATFPWISPC